MDDEDFWINLVEDSVELGWQITVVPLSSFSKVTARALADRLKVALLTEGTDYIFEQKRPKQSESPGDLNLH